MDLVGRVKGIILSPSAEWQTIDREPGDVSYLFMNYVAILAAIPAIASLIGTIMLGVSFGAALAAAILSYVLSFVSVYLVALIADALAPTFGGRKDMASALKLTTYSYTPMWLAGIFNVIPFLGILSLVGLYGVYLLYLGLPVLMKAPKDRAVVYTVVIIVCAIILSLIISAIIGVIVLRMILS